MPTTTVPCILGSIYDRIVTVRSHNSTLGYAIIGSELITGSDGSLCALTHIMSDDLKWILTELETAIDAITNEVNDGEEVGV